MEIQEKNGIKASDGILPAPITITDKKNQLRERFEKIRAYTESLCRSLAREDFGIQPVDFVSPPKWHLAHTSWFFEELILKAFKDNYKVFDEEFSFLFNSYYNNLGERVARSDRGKVSRPTVDAVFEYRKHVTSQVLNLLDQKEDPDMLSIIEVGINHEEQHGELLAYDIKYILGTQPLFPKYSPPFIPLKESREEKYIRMESDLYFIGHEGHDFCFDNELSRHKVYLPEFEISNRLVTNGDFIDFINDGGYDNYNLWHSDGWDWIGMNGIRSPLYWFEEGGQWWYYNYNGKECVDPELPLMHVSYYEAYAFAEWKGMRLPTEFEWEVAGDRLDWGQLWEWTSSAYQPYPGFKKAKGPLGEYNGKFMVNQQVMKGASVATPPGHSRKTYRNFFHPEMRWMFSGIRLAKTIT